eukprot:TRINITY_DN35953_c0_g1_i3.p3 TRINITY_DN35953_c0_g1~~TRINITY_DN35953_c0_g1_i3.p3  ORF type:complete len:263 (-),score=57.26 TRINITY_DN35953_c0_g1_i3:73-861(-)
MCIRDSNNSISENNNSSDNLPSQFQTNAFMSTGKQKNNFLSKTSSMGNQNNDFVQRDMFSNFTTMCVVQPRKEFEIVRPLSKQQDSFFNSKCGTNFYTTTTSTSNSNKWFNNTYLTQKTQEYAEKRFKNNKQLSALHLYQADNFEDFCISGQNKFNIEIKTLENDKNQINAVYRKFKTFECRSNQELNKDLLHKQYLSKKQKLEQLYTETTQENDISIENYDVQELYKKGQQSFPQTFNKILDVEKTKQQQILKQNEINQNQ